MSKASLTFRLYLSGILLLAVPIAKQLRGQGLRSNPASLATAWQVRAEEIFSMNVKGLLTDGQARKHRERLFKEIAANVVAVKRRTKGKS